jgi:hypothetical protein
LQANLYRVENAHKKNTIKLASQVKEIEALFESLDDVPLSQREAVREKIQYLLNDNATIINENKSYEQEMWEAKELLDRYIQMHWPHMMDDDELIPAVDIDGEWIKWRLCPDLYEREIFCRRCAERRVAVRKLELDTPLGVRLMMKRKKV